MVIPINIRAVHTAQRGHLAPGFAHRQRTLERLYQRKRAIQDLIRSIESYRQARNAKRCECIEFSAGRRCS